MNSESSERKLRWNNVKDGLPTEYGDYLVVREHAELHIVSVDVSNFHPKAESPWYDKGFIYLYWIGPVSMPEELEMVGRYTKTFFDFEMAQHRRKMVSDSGERKLAEAVRDEGEWWWNYMFGPAKKLGIERLQESAERRAANRAAVKRLRERTK